MIDKDELKQLTTWLHDHSDDLLDRASRGDNLAVDIIEGFQLLKQDPAFVFPVLLSFVEEYQRKFK